MRLLFISTMLGAPWGGSEVLWSRAALAALEDGHEVLVSVPEWPDRPAQITELQQRGARVEFRPRKPSRLSGIFAPPAWLRSVQRFEASAICLSQGSAYECAGRRASRPIARWLARESPPWVNVVQFNDDRADLDRRTRRLCQQMYTRASVNAFVARRNITQAARALEMELPRARVVCNPVGLADHSPLAWPQDDTLRLASVARLEIKAKGQDALLDALAAPAWADRTWSLSIAGAGPDRALLEQQVRDKGLDQRVRFLGQVADIRTLWQSHHALVLSSRAEGTPLAMIEAMLLGRPCVVTDVGGCADWVEPGLSGEVARSASTHDLGEAVERLWHARGDLQARGERARARALTLYDPSPGRTLLDLLIHAAQTSRSHSELR